MVALYAEKLVISPFDVYNSLNRVPEVPILNVTSLGTSLLPSITNTRLMLSLAVGYLRLKEIFVPCTAVIFPSRAPASAWNLKIPPVPTRTPLSLSMLNPFTIPASYAVFRRNSSGRYCPKRFAVAAVPQK